jgi:hypothetical protein
MDRWGACAPRLRASHAAGACARRRRLKLRRGYAAGGGPLYQQCTSALLGAGRALLQVTPIGRYGVAHLLTRPPLRQQAPAALRTHVRYAMLSYMARGGAHGALLTCTMQEGGRGLPCAGASWRGARVGCTIHVRALFIVVCAPPSSHVRSPQCFRVCRPAVVRCRGVLARSRSRSLGLIRHSSSCRLVSTAIALGLGLGDVCACVLWAPCPCCLRLPFPCPLLLFIFIVCFCALALALVWWATISACASSLRARGSSHCVTLTCSAAYVIRLTSLPTPPAAPLPISGLWSLRSAYQEQAVAIISRPAEGQPQGQSQREGTSRDEHATSHLTHTPHSTAHEHTTHALNAAREERTACAADTRYSALFTPPPRDRLMSHGHASHRLERIYMFSFFCSRANRVTAHTPHATRSHFTLRNRPCPSICPAARTPTPQSHHRSGRQAGT